MKRLIFILVFVQFIVFSMSGSDFVKTNGIQFQIGDKPYYFIGTNFWYGAILGSQGEGGNRERLLKELDLLSSIGVNNLRILVGADGNEGVRSKVEPTLQKAPGVYNDDILDGLDFLLHEMSKRKMYAVLYFNNSWEWSGGYSQYLNWSGEGEIPIPADQGWEVYTKFVGKFAKSSYAIELFKNHVIKIVTRSNRYSNKAYVDDPTIMSWQIGNEPRAFGADNKEAFVAWMAETSALIRSLDKNHLISTGSEGSKGSENDIELWHKIHKDKNIDYTTTHAWPNNWRWIDKKNIAATTAIAIGNTLEYINQHALIAVDLNKPIVLEEFGMPRDEMQFTPQSSTNNRDIYYKAIFEEILYHSKRKDVFAGCNFWAWAGYARPQHEFWKKGDDYMGDPAQEEQGLNSVYNTDSTILLIKNYASKLKESAYSQSYPIDINASRETKALYKNLKQIQGTDILFGQEDATMYGVDWKYDDHKADIKRVSGEYPAIYGWDIGDIEQGEDENLDGIGFDKIREHIIAAYKRGGVNTISWHINNPSTRGNSWDTTEPNVVRSILPNGVNHKLFMTWLDRVADFLLNLKDNNGEFIPIIFRPWHEHTGKWFWWGTSHCTELEYIELWKMTVSHLKDTRKINHLLYAYSPNTDFDKEKYLERYPGDNWVDILGFDSYQGKKESNEEFKKKLEQALAVISSLSTERNKVAAITETGYNTTPYARWWTDVLFDSAKKYSPAYILVWRNAYDIPNHYFGTFPGQISATNFKEAVDCSIIVLEKKLPEMYK